MPYSKFTLSKAVDDFHLTIVEGGRFLPETSPINPTPLLQEILKETLPWAIAVSTEKARSEGIINPVLLEVRRQLKGQISVFSGEEFCGGIGADAEAVTEKRCFSKNENGQGLRSPSF